MLILNISFFIFFSPLVVAEVEKGQKDQKDPGELMFTLWFFCFFFRHKDADTNRPSRITNMHTDARFVDPKK